jgi:hypothetical protein
MQADFGHSVLIPHCFNIGLTASSILPISRLP